MITVLIILGLAGLFMQAVTWKLLEQCQAEIKALREQVDAPAREAALAAEMERWRELRDLPGLEGTGTRVHPAGQGRVRRYRGEPEARRYGMRL